MLTPIRPSSFRPNRCTVAFPTRNLTPFVDCAMCSLIQLASERPSADALSFLACMETAIWSAPCARRRRNGSTVRADRRGRRWVLIRATSARIASPGHVCQKAVVFSDSELSRGQRLYIGCFMFNFQTVPRPRTPPKREFPLPEILRDLLFSRFSGHFHRRRAT